MVGPLPPSRPIRGVAFKLSRGNTNAGHGVNKQWKAKREISHWEFVSVDIKRGER